MNSRTFENGLALAGAVLVLVGVIFAAGAALADETNTIHTTNTTTQKIIDVSLANAESANRTAVNEAAASVIVNNRLDLDIRLHDNSSLVITRNL